MSSPGPRPSRPPRPFLVPRPVLALLALTFAVCALAAAGRADDKAELEPESYYYEHGLVPPKDDETLLASTLDGRLVAIDKESGDVLWQLNDEPVVKSPYDSAKPVLPAFLPDPKDGSIYMLGGGFKEPLKKLPFTIPELVAASPCKSTDGILYTGKKVDTWFAVDRSLATCSGNSTTSQLSSLPTTRPNQCCPRSCPTPRTAPSTCSAEASRNR
jgi:hypothetical protein